MSNICKEKVEKLITISILMSFSKTPPKQTVEKKLTKYFKKCCTTRIFPDILNLHKKVSTSTQKNEGIKIFTTFDCSLF